MSSPYLPTTDKGRGRVYLAAEDSTWTPTPADRAAALVALPEVRSSLRAQTADTIPWKSHVWEVLLPHASRFVRVWTTRQPHEKSIGGRQRRCQDHYLVLLKRSILNSVFDTLHGDIIGHLCDPQTEVDAVHRASIERRINGLNLLDETGRRKKLRELTSQWLTNCTKSARGPRWLQEFNKAINAQQSVSPAVTSAHLPGVVPDPREIDDNSGTLYQGRAHSAKELFSVTAPHKDDVMARTGQLIAQRGDGNADGTDIRYWRRALEQVWDETTEDVRQLFMEKAAARASRINRGYQQVDRSFAEVVTAARGLQGIDGAFGAIVIETRKWCPSLNNWEAVRYVLTTIASKTPTRLQNTWDFSTYDQVITDWCDARRIDAETSDTIRTFSTELEPICTAERSECLPQANPSTRATPERPPIDQEMDTPTFARMLQSPLHIHSASPAVYGVGIPDVESEDETSQRQSSSSGTPIGLPQRQSTPLAAALDIEQQDPSSTDDQRNTVTSTEVENEITQLQRTANSERNSAETSISQVEIAFNRLGTRNSAARPTVDSRGTEWSMRMADRKREKRRLLEQTEGELDVPQRKKTRAALKSSTVTPAPVAQRLLRYGRRG